MPAISELLIHPKSQKQADQFLKSPPHSILIVGNPGSGKLSLAKAIASRLLNSDDLSKAPYFVHIKKPPDRSEISIEASREITHLLRLKTPGKDGIKRVILIENAQFLSDEAQNALLKILEEPNDDTVFILTAAQKNSLLPTIVSRCQVMQLPPISLRQAEEYFKNRYSQTKLNSAWQLSQGEPELMAVLLMEEASHPLKQAVEQAKEFLGQSKYRRLLMLEGISKNKDNLNSFLGALAKVLSALHRSAVTRQQNAQASKLLKDRQLIRSSVEAIDDNGNLRLITLKLILNLNN